MKKQKQGNAVMIMLLTVLTFGIYGAYWAMTQSAEEADYEDDDIEKDADSVKRAAASALLMRHDLH